MMLITLLLHISAPAAATSVEEVLARVKAYSQAAQTMSAEITFTVKGLPAPGHGKITFERPANLRYDMDIASERYTFVAHPGSTIDYERSARIYDEYLGWEALQPIDSAISSVPDVFPAAIYLGNFRYEPVGQMTLVGTEDIGGIKADHLNARGSQTQLDAYVAPSGQIVRYVVSAGNKAFTMDLSGYAVNKPVSSALFNVAPPLGFHERSLPYEVRPLGIGETFPSGWTNASTQATGNVTGDKDSFVLVAALDSEPSAKSAVTLTHAQGTMGLKVAVVSTSPKGEVAGALKGFATFYDPTGNLIKRLSIPGTPLFYLLDPSGKVKKIWYGYDPQDIAAFEKDIQQASAAKDGTG